MQVETATPIQTQTVRAVAAQNDDATQNVWKTTPDTAPPMPVMAKQKQQGNFKRIPSQTGDIHAYSKRANRWNGWRIETCCKQASQEL